MNSAILLDAAASKMLQLCPTLCDSIDGSPPVSPVPGILQARTLEWVAISFSNARKWKVKVKSLCQVRLLATPWTEACRLLCPGIFPAKEYWSGLPLPSPNIAGYNPVKANYFYIYVSNKQKMKILNRHCLQQNKTFEYLEIHLKVKVKSLSRVRPFATPRAVACTRLLRPWDFLGKSTGVGLPFPSPGNRPDPGIKPRSPAL